MPRKLSVLGAAATAALTAVALFAPAAAASNTPRSTVACTGVCTNLFSAQLGSDITLNAYVHGDNGTGGKTGVKVNLHLDGNYRPNGDWDIQAVGQVWQFCGFFANDFFSPTSYICTHYQFFDVFEATWAPFGNETSLCAGVRSATAGTAVTLQPCGSSAKTVWIADRAHATLNGDCRNDVTTLPVGPGTDPTVEYCAWINGGDTSFSHPLVATLNTGSRNPTNALLLEPENLVGGLARSNQLFAHYAG